MVNPRGQLVVVGAAFDPIEVMTSDLIFGGRSIVGSLTGTPRENATNMAFSAAHGVAPMIEMFSFEDAPKAHDRMVSGDARLRVVLDIAAQ
jgi:D-arabinose 1-dehydrogenase-like Zn-dependent alcohol dehydrogenase